MYGSLSMSTLSLQRESTNTLIIEETKDNTHKGDILIYTHILSHRIHKGGTLVRLLILHDVFYHAGLNIFPQLDELLPLEQIHINTLKHDHPYIFSCLVVLSDIVTLLYMREH